MMGNFKSANVQVGKLIHTCTYDIYPMKLDSCHIHIHDISKIPNAGLVYVPWSLYVLSCAN